MRRKLIEVALPLDAINAASAREKSIRHGHPSTLHLWWARRPLAAARAVIFAQMVDDPSEYVDVLLSDAGKKRAAQRALKKRLAARASAAAAPQATGNGTLGAGEKPGGATVEAEPRAPTLDDVAAELERARLFGIVEELVLWENTTNEEVLKRARTEIWQSWRRACAENAGHPRAAELFDRHTLPAFHDPFAGGGALPLEAQRLGLDAHASDLNPVAVLINKAMIEIPPKFAGRPAVNPESRGEPTVIAKTWRGAQGLAEDVRHYGRWMREEAEKRIGHLYPPIEVTSALVRERPDLKPYEGRKLGYRQHSCGNTLQGLSASPRVAPEPAAGARETGGVGKPALFCQEETLVQDEQFGTTEHAGFSGPYLSGNTRKPHSMDQAGRPCSRTCCTVDLDLRAHPRGSLALGAGRQQPATHEAPR